MLNVMIVEDNQLAAIAAKLKLLTCLDVNVVMINNGEEAVEHYRNHDIALVLMDIGLGDGINGAEAAKKIRDIESDNESKRCPIYALTAHADAEDIAYQTSMGIDKTFKKPMANEMLEYILENTPGLASAIKS